MPTETNREVAERVAWSVIGNYVEPVRRGQLIDAIEAALRNVSNRVCDECASDLADGSGFCATCDNFTMPSDFYLRWMRRTQMDDALNAERERCAKIAEAHSATDCNGPDCGIEIAKAIRGKD